MDINETLANVLKELDIEYTVLEHDVIKTMAEGKEIMTKLEGVIPINLLLKDKSNTRYLLVKQMENKTKFKTIGKTIKAKSLQMEAKSALSEVLSVPEGCATIFALLNDTNHDIVVIIDASIPKDGKVNFHPLRNDATMTISYEDMVRFIEHLGNEIRYF